MSDTEKKLRAKIKKLELELATIKNATFTSEGSAFKGLHSHLVKWKFDGYARTFVLVCKACGAYLGPVTTKSMAGKL